MLSRLSCLHVPATVHTLPQLQSSRRGQLRIPVAVPEDTASQFNLERTAGPAHYGASSPDGCTTVLVSPQQARHLLPRMGSRGLRDIMYQALHHLPVLSHVPARNCCAMSGQFTTQFLHGAHMSVWKCHSWQREALTGNAGLRPPGAGVLTS